jgi:hypothetical protein
MSENRLSDYLGHIRQAATDAMSFSEGLSKEQFQADKRTQQTPRAFMRGSQSLQGDASDARASFSPLSRTLP